MEWIYTDGLRRSMGFEGATGNSNGVWGINF
jgi:hypothetical protein